MPAVRVVDEHLLSPVLVYSSSNGVFQNELILVVEDGLTKEINENQLIVKGFTFDNDLTVSLAGGRSFGRYASGTTIPSTGKTPAEVIQMAIVEPIDPTVTLTSPTRIEFNQEAIDNILNFSHTINTLGGTVTSATLQWRRGDAGEWMTLSSDLSPSGTFTHSLTDTNYNTNTFNYLYTVTDSAGASSTAAINIVPSSYVAPTITLTVNAQTKTAPETNTKRECGNISSHITGTITRNADNTELIYYTLQCRINNTGIWHDITSPVCESSAVEAVVIDHYDQSFLGASSIAYRVVVTDTYQAELGTQVTSSIVTVSFVNQVYYGPSSSLPTNSDSIRALANHQFVDQAGNITLNTGNVDRFFTIALPAGTTVASVIDLDALNANITNNYILTNIDLINAGGVATQYNVYTMTNAIPYSDNHRHQITRH